VWLSSPVHSRFCVKNRLLFLLLSGLVFASAAIGCKGRVCERTSEQSQEPTPSVEEGFVESDEDDVIETDEIVEDFSVDILVLSPQQLAQANEFFASFEGKELGDLVQIYAALQGAMNAVPVEEQAVLEYVIQKLAVLIAELD